MKKRLFLLPILTLSLGIAGIFGKKTAENTFAYSSVEEMKQDNKVLTISELGNATINNGSYYDDGIIYYTNSGSTVGYFVEENILVDFNISYDDGYAHPMWLGFSFKAGEYNRTQSAFMEKKGYSFIVFSSGEVQLFKEGEMISLQAISIPTAGVKYNYCMGTKTEVDGTRLLFSIDNKIIIDYLDTNPVEASEKSWFNISGDGGTACKIYSLKKTRLIPYNHFTLSDFNFYPEIAGRPTIDKYNNIKINSSADSVGFNNRLENFALEVKINFESADPGTNLWFALRSTTFDRATNIPDGYIFRIGYFGVIEIYKAGTEGGLIGSSGATFEIGKDIRYEFGTVNTTLGGVLIYACVNGQTVLTVEDNTNPWKHPGMVIVTPDGNIIPRIYSTNNALSVLQVKKVEGQIYDEYKFFIRNSVSAVDQDYASLSNRMREAIIVGGNNLNEINKRYYTKDGDTKIRAVDTSIVSNVLIVKVAKEFYEVSDDSLAGFSPEGIEIVKTTSTSGIYSDQGYALAQSYYYSF